MGVRICDGTSGSGQEIIRAGRTDVRVLPAGNANQFTVRVKVVV
jgi:hypothetical protein